jgi:beta-glucanase (GH16 family)
MKNFTLPAICLAGLFFVGLGSCKKLTPAKQGSSTTVVNVNPKIATTVCNYDLDETTLTSNGWTKTFDDEFNGDLSNWFAYTGGVQNEEELNQPANAVIANGVLQLTAKQETVTGPTTEAGPTPTKSFNYTSASIVSNQTFVANATTPKVRIVARVKMASGYGLTSLFYSYGASPWPTNGQINFFQVAGSDLGEYSTNYFYGTSAGQNLVNGGILYTHSDADLSACWHVFMTEWTQNSINYYLDGQLVETKTAGGYVPSLFGKPQNLSLSLPIGGLYYSNFVPANIQVGSMSIDYVKVFTSK